MAKGFTPIIGLAVVVALALAAVFGSMSLANPAAAQAAAPSGLSAMGGDGQVTVSWNTVTGADWEIQVAEDSGNFANADWQTDSDPSITDASGLANGKTGYVVTGVTNTLTYKFRVRQTPNGLPSGIVRATPAAPPDPGDNLEAEAGVRSVTLTWDTDDEDTTSWQMRYVSGETDIPVGTDATPEGGQDWMTINPTFVGDDATFVVRPLTSGLQYSFQLRAVTHDTPSTASDTAQTTDLDGTGSNQATPKPDVVKGLEADTADGSVTLSWNDPKDDGVTEWRYEYKKSDVEEYGTVQSMAKPMHTDFDADPNNPNALDADVTLTADQMAMYDAAVAEFYGEAMAEITGLENGEEYSFRVWAVASSTAGEKATIMATPNPIPPFSPTFTATSLEAGDSSRYDLKVQVRDGVMNTLTDELIIKLEDFDVASSIGMNSIAINVDEQDDDEDRTTIPEDVSVSGEKIFITIGDLNKDRTGGSAQQAQGETADFDIEEGAIIHVVIRQSAGVKNPTEAKTYGPVVTVEQVISALKLVDVAFDAENDDGDPMYPGLRVTVPFVLKLDEEDGGLDTVVMAEGLGFKDGTSLTVFVDKPVHMDDDGNPNTPMSDDDGVTGEDTKMPNRMLDAGEDTVCVAAEISKADIGTCEFTVTHPVFTGGKNYLNAVDGRNNYVSANEDLAVFTLEESISLSPKSGNPGEVILVQAVDFDPNATIGRIQLSRRTIEGTAGGRVDSSGSGNISFTIPNWAKAGTQEVRVYVGDKNATKNITIGGPRVTATPQTVVANQRISLVGTGFSPNERLGDSDQAAGSKISIGGDPIDWNKVNDGDDVMVDSGGNWSASVDLPLVEASTGGGEQTIRITDSDDRTGTTTVTLADRDFEIDPTQGRVGTLAVVRGWGYPGKNDEGESFNVTVQYKVSGDPKVTVSVVPDASGRFEAQVRIPTTAAIPSTNTVEVSFDLEGRDSGRKVVETKQHDVPEGIINLSATSGGPGTTVTLTGEGFKTYVPVRSVKIGSIEVTPSPRPSTDVNGMMQFDLLIPGLDVGIQTLEVQVGSTTASVGFTVVESGVEPGAIKPVAVGVEALGDNLVSIWHFNNDTKVWSFYAPVLEEGNTMTHVITGETYLILIKSTTEVILNRETRSLTCVGGNCWNQIVW